MPKCSDANCTSKSTVRVWCPTWVTAHNGPKYLCKQHAEIFDPTQNDFAVNGQFFTDKEADARFKSVERFIPSTDERYAGALGMIQNGTILRGNNVTAVSAILSVVDGKAWIGGKFLIVCLGNYHEIKKDYPIIFNLERKTFPS